MKKTIIAMLAFVFVSISGISYAADKVFALVPKAMNNPFFDLARDGCKAAEKEIGGIECLYIGPGEHTEQEQVQIVQDLIADHAFNNTSIKKKMLDKVRRKNQIVIQTNFTASAGGV